MKFNGLKGLFITTLLIVSCSGNVEYSKALKAETTGRYLYNQDEILDVYYKQNNLFISWKDTEIKPVALDKKTFFVPDMYQKLRFVKQPKTGKPYLAVIPENATDTIHYAYPKVSDSFKTPSMHFKLKNYHAALEGYMAIKQQDSISNLINENHFNSIGYNYLSNKNYDDAIAVFKINVALFPNSSNVYDSLAEAYLKQGDSLNAYTYYKKALGFNSNNRRAKAYISAYKNEAETN